MAAEDEDVIDAGPGDPLGILSKPVVKSNGDPLGILKKTESVKKKDDTSVSSQNGVPDLLQPHPSSSVQANGTSALQQGAAAIKSVENNNVPQVLQLSDAEQAAQEKERNQKTYFFGSRPGKEDEPAEADDEGAITTIVPEVLGRLQSAAGKVVVGVPQGLTHLITSALPDGAQPAANKINGLFNWANDKFEAAKVNNPLPDNFAGKALGSVIDTAPVIAAAAATGGSSLEGQFAGQMGEATGGYLTKQEILQNSLTQASGPITKYLGATGFAEGLNNGSDQSNNQFIPTLLGGFKGAQEGLESGIMLEGQMAAGEKLGGKLFNLAVKNGVVNEDAVMTQQALKSIVGSPVSFATASVAQDLANGRPVDWENAGISAVTALPFEAGHLGEAADKANEISTNKEALNANIQRLMQVSENNALINFSDATPGEISDAMKTPESSAELQILALGKGVQAQDAQTLAAKNNLHADQLQLQKLADIKSIGEKIQSNGVASFHDAIGQTDFPDELKQSLINNSTLVHQNTIETIDQKITENLQDGITHAQDHIDQLNEQFPEATVAQNPEAINALIDMVETRTDLQEKLLDHTDTNEAPVEVKVDPYETELEKLGYTKAEIETFDEKQKQHIIQHNVVNDEQGKIQQANEASANVENADTIGNSKESTERGGNNETVSSNGDNLTTSTTEISHSPTGDGSTEQSREENGTHPVDEPFTYQTKEHGLLDIQHQSDGKYLTTFSDGSSDHFTQKELQDFYGVEPGKLEKAEQGGRLYATNHPGEIAHLFLDKHAELHDVSNPQSAIAQYGPRIDDEKHFAEVNDKNNITNQIRLNYFRKREGATTDLHDQADEINNISFGGAPIVTAEDVAQFMVDFPAGERSFFSIKGNSELKEIADRYYEVTGKRLTKANAEKIAATVITERSAIDPQFTTEVNRELVDKVMDEIFQDKSDRVTVEEWANKVRSQFEEYVKDPEEVFNIFYPVWEGLVLNDEQINYVNESITERQNGQEPGGRSDDQSAVESKSTGMGNENGPETSEDTGQPENAESASGTETTEGDEHQQQVSDPELDDLPFQKATGDQMAPEKVNLAKNLLEKTFPNVKAEFHEDVESFERSLNDNGIETHADNLPNAFVGEDGVIHFNPEKINEDTQLHEYGHVLTQWAEQNAPKLYERMQRLGKEATNIHAELKENGYLLTGKRLYDEAFVTMLGRDGVGKLDEAIKNSGTRGVVKSFINDVWNKFQRYLLEKTGFDITKFKNIKNMGIQEFMNTLNSKYLLSGTEISKVSGEDLAGENSLQIKKPEKQPGETMAEYARRLGEWKRDVYDNPQGRTRNELNRVLKPVREKLAELNRSFQEGVKKAKADTKTAFLEYDAYRKSKEKERVSDLKAKYEEKLKAEKTAGADKLAQYKEDTKQAFLEYDAAKKGQTTQRLNDLRVLYQNKLADEHALRLEQTTALKEGFKNIRKEIGRILEGLRKSGELGGVKFSAKDVLAFANQVNKVTTEKGLERFKDFIVRASQNVDYIRDLNDNKALIKDAKSLLKKDYVPANMKTLIRELTSLNPNRVESPKEFKTILNDVNEALRAKQAPMKSEAEINDFINKEREYDIKVRGADLADARNQVEASDEHTAVAEQKGSTLPDDYDMHREIQKITRNPELTHNEKVKRLNEIDQALSEYHDSLRKSIDPITNEVVGEPEDFNKILDEIRTGDSTANKETLRDNLEESAKGKQSAIDPEAEGLSPEQRDSLKILKEVPLSGEDANTLRLYNNVLENVLLNDSHDGIGLFEAKEVGNGNDGAEKIVNYFTETGRKTKDANFNTFGKFRKAALDLSVMLSRIANGDNTFVTKLVTGTHFDQIKNGFTEAKQRYHDVMTSKLEKVFKQHQELARSADSAHRLTLYSYINQNREFSSPEQMDAQLIKRVKTIYKDIFLKSTEGLERDKDEAIREKRVWSEFEEKIKDKTGIDVSDPQVLKQLTYDQIKDIEFLNPGEREAYNTIRAADDVLRPEHEAVVKRQLNKPYETWNNHMRDNYRLLKSGLTDVTTGTDLGFSTAPTTELDGSGASIERVKGDPLAQKEAKNQRVIAMNFFDNQQQAIKDMLYDIHTLKERQTFDAALKNKDLRDVIGNENHQIYKDAIQAYVMNEMGLNKGMGTPELRLVNQSLNVIAKIGTSRQLFSVLAHPKHYLSNLFNVVVTIGKEGPKLLAQAHAVMGDQGVQELLKQHPISERADNLASLNMTSNEAHREGENDEQGKMAAYAKTILTKSEDAINHWILGINKDGTSNEKLISKPIKIGDTKSAEWGWITYYAKHLIDNGKADDFNSIDWNKENANPDREAAAYAEQMTSKQMNENTKGARSTFLTSRETGFVAAKYLLFPFGSRNMHNLQTMVENLRTIASRDTIVDKDYRQNQTNAAVHSILGLIAQESVFQAVRIGGALGFAYVVKQGLTYALASMFADDKEKQMLMDKVQTGIENSKDHALHQWLSESIAGSFLGGLGSGPQSAITGGVNKLVGTDLFYEPTVTANQIVQNANNYGMIGSAFNGLGDQAKDTWRLIDNNNKDGVAVHIDPYQKAVFGVSLLSNALALAGMNDANVNRSVESLRKQVEFSLASKFKEPNYEDLSAPSALKLGNKVIMLSPDHQTFYEQIKQNTQYELEQKGFDSKKAATLASKRAKSQLIQKFGYDALIKEGKIEKKK